MARMVVPSMFDSNEGHPVARRVDGINVEECAAHHGANAHFGKIRKTHIDYVNSKTGSRMAKPEDAPDDNGGGPDFY